jgi:hypothetical protein
MPSIRLVVKAAADKADSTKFGVTVCMAYQQHQYSPKL